MARLANNSKGLTPYALRQLYLACVTSISDYGSPIWWRGQKSLLKPLQSIQNLVLRKILGVFKTAPIIPLEIETALPPPEIRLNSILRKYALRMLKISQMYLINIEFSRFQELQKELELGLKSLKSLKSLKPIQIERIYTSIENLVDFKSLESLKSLYFAPWNKEIPFLIKIDKNPKDIAAKNHIQAINAITSNTTKSIYTDASSINGSSIGVGFTVFQNRPNTPVFSDQWNIGGQQLVYNGELEAITVASEYASKDTKVGDHFDIYADNQAAIQRLAKISDNPGQEQQIRTILASRKIVQKGGSISINWVPGHKDILGNEIADSLAKEATKFDPYSNRASFALLGLKVKQIQTREWKQLLQAYTKKLEAKGIPSSYYKSFGWKLGSKLLVSKGTQRELASAFYQLKIGHGYIKSYLKRINRSSIDKCTCGLKETPQHLILWCKNYKIERSILKESLNSKLTLPVLLHTKPGSEKCLEFLNSTKICTRQWHLNRNTA
jgi:ribonuclease HI